MLLGASQSLSPVVTFMALQFTLMARDCFDALQNWSNEHAYVEVILSGRSSGLQAQGGKGPPSPE